MEENTRKVCVLDSSFILAYLLPDEGSKKVQLLFDQYKKGQITLLSTMLLPFEVVSGLYAATLSKRIKTEVAKKLINEFLKLPIDLKEINLTSCFDISIKLKISVYDASYVFLSRGEGAPLLTLDRKLQNLA